MPSEYIKNLYRATLAFVVILSLYFAVKVLSEFRAYDMMGSRDNVITLSGHGEVQAVPDIANIYFTISKDAKTGKEAQDSVTQIEKKALDLLKADNVLEKDIKTVNASFYPKYEYSQSCADGHQPWRCPPNNQIIVGYTASESINVKVRNTDDVGKIIQELVTVGAFDLNGPNFSIDNEDTLKAEARKKAIDDAKEKAKVLAKDLGVNLGRIANFSESGNYPIMYAREKMMSADASTSSVPAVIPKGENTISSDVTITYEIR